MSCRKIYKKCIKSEKENIQKRYGIEKNIHKHMACRKKHAKNMKSTKHMHALHEHVCVHIPPRHLTVHHIVVLLGHYSEQVAV